MKVAQKCMAGHEGSLQITCPCFLCKHVDLSYSFPVTSQCDASVAKIINRLEIVKFPNSVGVKAHVNKVKERDFQSML